MGYTFSTVTIAFNNLEELKKTMESVDNQTYPPHEHIIVDGSTGIEIKKYLNNSKQPSYRRWISERDEGISDAFNKGIKMATGDVVHLLNSGDLYYDETILEKEAEVFNMDPSIQWTHGQYLQHMGDQWVITGEPFTKKKLHRGLGKVGHPTMFVKKALYEKHGYFDKEFRYAMDFDFLIRIRDEKFQYIAYPITIFTPGGVSNLKWKAAYEDVVKSYVRHKGWDIWIIWGYIYQMLFYNIMKTPLGKWLLKVKNRSRIKEKPDSLEN